MTSFVALQKLKEFVTRSTMQFAYTLSPSLLSPPGQIHAHEKAVRKLTNRDTRCNRICCKNCFFFLDSVTSCVPQSFGNCVLSKMVSFSDNFGGKCRKIEERNTERERERSRDEKIVSGIETRSCSYGRVGVGGWP